MCVWERVSESECKREKERERERVCVCEREKGTLGMTRHRNGGVEAHEITQTGRSMQMRCPVSLFLSTILRKPHLAVTGEELQHKAASQLVVGHRHHDFHKGGQEPYRTLRVSQGGVELKRRNKEENGQRARKPTERTNKEIRISMDT